MRQSIQPLSGTTVIFDLDGTLVNTAPDLQATLNHVLLAHGCAPVTPDVTDKLIGHGAKAMLRAGLGHQGITPGEPQLDDMFTLFLKYYSENIAVHSQPYEGCASALSRLEQAGATLAVCTNKTQSLADQLLKTLSLYDRFACIIGADSVPQKKPDAGHIFETLEQAKGKRERAIMVGDSQTDERAAHTAELPFLFAPFGYGPLDKKQSHIGGVLDHYDHLSVEMIIKMLPDRS